MNQIVVNYDRQAICPLVEKFLSEVVTPEDKKGLLQFLGYCLIPTSRFEKAMMLIGAGANGKSTFLKLVTAMLGKDNISALSLLDLEHPFRLSCIVGKLVNISSDLPLKKIPETAIFKAIVSGDPLTGEMKYGKPFTFVPYVKLLFSTNKLPATQDTSDAFFRRWLIIEFPNTFNDEKRDTGLIDELTTPQELEGLAQLAIQGLNELYANEGFLESTKMKELSQDYKRANNSVQSFVEERCSIYAKSEIKKADLYIAYQKYCSEEKLPIMGRNEFGKELKRQLPMVKEISTDAKKWRSVTLDEQASPTV